MDPWIRKSTVPLRLNVRPKVVQLPSLTSQSCFLTTPSVDKRQSKIFYEGVNVRISKYKQVFAKGYIPNWTNEVFTVFRVLPTTPVTYLLKDNKGELLQGGFYGHEMQLSKVGDVYLIEKILKRKNDKVLVRWLGFDKKHDSWITTKDLV